MNETHWTTDPELLERYALEKISESERRQLDEHLQTCAECGARIKDEMEIVQGVKMFGRRQLKDKLQQRLAQEPSRRMPWMRIMSAAATVVIILGISIYNEWYTPSQKQQVASKPGDSQGDMKGVIAERDAAAKQEISEAAKDREETKTGLKSPVKKETRTEVPEKLQSPSEKREDRSALTAAAQSSAGVAQQRTERVLSLDEMRDRPQDLHDDQVWVEGTVIPQTEKNDAFGKAGRQNKSLKSPVAQAQEAGGRPFSMQKIQIEQMSAKTLPALQQQKQKLLNINSVQTLVTRTDQGLRMTMYLDSLLQQADFRNAIIKQVTADSIVIEFPNQRIGYQMPTRWHQKAAKKSLQK